ncbi:hypothetical protein [Komagataeibacter xylinus]|uniref:hypothetical protein n=1 Tax=Komagataeibacter xylinus TaxID=28448 RepID=UPI00280C2F6A|nr:hypothetical protein [Komagataeibacter xylinus]
MAQTTFAVDANTMKALESLKKSFGVKTNAQVIRKALALALVANQNADSSNTLTVLSPDGEKKQILMSA